MPTLAEIRDRVKLTVQDTTFSDALINSYINEGIQRVASLVLIPDLEDIGTVTTEVNEYVVDIPPSWNFDRNIFMCTGPEDQKVQVLSSIAMLGRKFVDFRLNKQEGSVEACTTTQTQFFYYPIPTTAEVYTCGFYIKPTLLTADTETPSIFPDFLHYALLESFASAEIYDKIEDGMDGIKTNARHYRKKFDEAVEDLKGIFRTGQSRPEPYRTKDLE